MVDLSGTCLGDIVAVRWRQIGEARARTPLESLQHAAQGRSERRDFAAALGVNEEDITSCPSLPGTQALVETFREIVGDRPVAEAVAALYAYEAQVPEIATTKMDGLRNFYGICSPRALAYFTLHEEVDKAHRAAWRSWLEEHAYGDDEEILATTNVALNALWGALDAVHCAHV